MRPIHHLRLLCVPKAKNTVLVAIGLVCAFIAILNIYGNIVIQNDDLFVLPEKAWFADSGSYLWHLLFFNQSRFTWVGDFHLFRPALFGFYYFYDRILVNFDPGVLALSLALINTLLFAILFLYFSKISTPLVGYLSGLFAVFPSFGGILFYWPHIHSYALAVAFFGCGVVVSYTNLRRDLDRYRNIAMFLAFMAASLFHEFAFLAILLLLGYHLLERACPQSSLLVAHDRSKVLFLVVGIYITFRAAIYITFEEYSFDEQASVPSLNRLVSSQSISSLVEYLVFLFSTLKPLPPAVAGLVYLIGFFHAAFKRNFLVLASYFAFFSIIFLIYYGRISVRGSVSPWYFPMLTIFIMSGILYVLSFLLKVKNISVVSSAIISLVLLFNVVSNSLGISTQQAARASINKNVHDFIGKVKTRLSSKECYGGGYSEVDSGAGPFVSVDIFTGKASYEHGSGFPNKFASTLLIDSACKTKGDLQPVYFFRRSDGSLKNFMVSYQRSDVLAPSVFKRFDSNKYIGITGLGPNNIHKVRGSLSHLDIMPSRLINIPAEYQGVSLSFISIDSSPIMLNTAISIKGAEGVGYYIALSNSDILVSEIRGAVSRLISVDVLPAIRPSFDITVAQFRGDCFAFVNNYLISHIPSCSLKDGLVVSSFPNGTESETLSGVHLLSNYQVNLF